MAAHHMALKYTETGQVLILLKNELIGILSSHSFQHSLNYTKRLSCMRNSNKSSLDIRQWVCDDVDTADFAKKIVFIYFA